MKEVILVHLYYEAFSIEFVFSELRSLIGSYQ